MLFFVILCMSHTCITLDLSKSNKQVMHFINTVFAKYYNYYWEGGHGHIWYFCLWADNCKSSIKIIYTLAGGLLSYKNTTCMPFLCSLCLGYVTLDYSSDCLGFICCLVNSPCLAQPRGEKISQLPKG